MNDQDKELQALQQELANLKQELELQNLNKELSSLREEKTKRPESRGYQPRLEDNLESTMTGGLPPPDLSETGRHAARYAKDIGVGIGNIPNLPALGLEIPRYAYQKGAHFINPDKNPDTSFGKLLPNLGTKFGHAVDTATKGYTVPRSRSERMGSDVVEGVSGLLGGNAILKGLQLASKVPSFVQNMYRPTAANVGASAGASAGARHYIEEHPNQKPSPLGIVGSSVLGGYLGAKAPHSLASKANTIAGMATRGLKENLGRAAEYWNPLNVVARGIGTAFRVNPKAVKLANDIDVPITMGQAAESRLPGMIESVGQHHPFTSGIFDKIAQRQESGMAKNLGVTHYENLREAVKEPATHLAKKGAQGYADLIKEKHENINKGWAPKHGQVKAERALVPVSDIYDNLAKDLKNIRGEGELSQFYRSAEGKALRRIEELLVNEKGFPALSAAQQAKMGRDLRNMKKNGKSPEEIDSKISSSYYGPLKEKFIPFQSFERLSNEIHDLRKAAIRGSTERGVYGETGHAMTNRRHEFIEKVGTPAEAAASREAKRIKAEYKEPQTGLEKAVLEITGASNDKDAFALLLSGDPRHLEAVRKGLSAREQHELLNSLIVKLGTNHSTGRLSLMKTQTGLHKQEPKVLDNVLELFGNEKPKTIFTKTMDFIGEHKAKLDKIVNSSNTANRLMWAQQIGKYGKAVWDHDPKLLAAALLSDAFMYGGSKLLTNQKVLNRIGNVMHAKSLRAQENHLSLFAKLPEVKDAISLASRQTSIQRLNRIGKDKEEKENE